MNLYPRLPLPVAAELLRQRADQAERSTTGHLELLRKEARSSHPAAFYRASGGTAVTTQQIDRVREDVEALVDDLHWPAPLDPLMAQEFDRRIVRSIRDSTALMPAEAGCHDIWAFLALVPLSHVALWRFPSAQRDRLLQGDLTRHVFGRAWWRGHVLVDTYLPDGERYRLIDGLKESELNQLLERTAIGGNPPLVRALGTAYMELPPERQGRAFLRDAAKRILRLTPYIAFEALSKQEMAKVIESAFAQSDMAFQAAGLTPDSSVED